MKRAAKGEDSGRHFLLRVLYNAVWWAQSYSPTLHYHHHLSTHHQSFPSEQHHSKNRMRRKRGASGRRFLLRVYNHRERNTTLFGGHNRTPPTLHYHHQLSTQHNLFPICMISPPNHPQYIYIFCLYSICHRLCTVHDRTWNSHMKYGHETVVDSISTYQFQRLDTAVVYILSLECLIAIYWGLGFVHNVMGIHLCTTQSPWVGGQTFTQSAWPGLNSMLKVTLPCLN